MATPQEIIEKLKDKGMSYAAIGAGIGSSRESVSRIAHGLQSGDRSLAKLEKLARGAGVQTISQYVPSNKPAKPQPRDVAPLTSEQLEHEEVLDRYERFEQYAPIAAKADQAIGGIRGRIIESILPENYSLVKSYEVPKNARVVESAPRPHRPRRRKSRQRSTSHTIRSVQNDPIVFVAIVIFSAFLPKSTNPRISAPVQQVQSSPRYVPAHQHRDTQEYLTLSVPRTPRINPMGYAPQEVGQVEQPRPYFGIIPTNRYNS